MAKAILSPLISQISGSVGAATFRSVSGETILTQKQAAPLHRNIQPWHTNSLLYRASSAWDDATDDVQQFWKVYWRTEKPTHFITHKPYSSPRAVFTAYQMIRLHCFLEPLVDNIPPSPVFVVPDQQRFWLRVGFTETLTFPEPVGQVRNAGLFTGRTLAWTPLQHKAVFVRYHDALATLEGHLLPAPRRFREYVKVWPLEPPVWDTERIVFTDYNIFRTLGRYPGEPPVMEYGAWSSPWPHYSYYAVGVQADGLALLQRPRVARSTFNTFWNTDPLPPCPHPADP